MSEVTKNAQKHWITTVAGLVPILLMLAATFLGLTAEEGSAIQGAVNQIIESINEGQGLVAVVAVGLGAVGNVLLVFSRDPKKKKDE